MNIIYKHINDLKPYKNNPRINNNSIGMVAESIKKFGFRNPIIIDKNDVIIAGHTRFKASIQLGLVNIPCIVVNDLTDKQIKAFRLADNKVSELSEWDNILLKNELIDIKDELGSILEIFDLNDFNSNFVPKYEPQFSNRVLDEDDINKKNNELTNKFNNNQNLRTLLCPHCEGELTIEL